MHTTLIENSMVINDSQPEYCVERVMHILNQWKKSVNGSKILLLGVAYKQDIDDYRESPAIRVYRELELIGAEVEYYDPWIPKFKDTQGKYKNSIPELNKEVIAGYDLVIITCAHTNINYAMVQENAKVIFDTKNAMKDMRKRNNIEVL